MSSSVCNDTPYPGSIYLSIYSRIGLNGSLNRAFLSLDGSLTGVMLGQDRKICIQTVTNLNDLP